MDLYVDSKELPPIPPKGRYTVRAPEAFGADAFGATKAGFLSVRVDPIIIAPAANEHYTIRYTKVSAKPFNRNGVRVSQVGDYLRATGRRQNVSGNPQEIADAVAETANSVFEINADWRAYCKGCQFSLEGMQKFPSDGNGGHVPVVTCPTCKDAETGLPLQLKGNLIVTRYVSAVA